MSGFRIAYSSPFCCKRTPANRVSHGRQPFGGGDGPPTNRFSLRVSNRETDLGGEASPHTRLTGKRSAAGSFPPRMAGLDDDTAVRRPDCADLTIAPRRAIPWI